MARRIIAGGVIPRVVRDRASRRPMVLMGIATALLMVLGTGPATGAELKVGFVDAARVLEEAPQLDNVRKRLEQEFSDRDQELVEKQQRIRELERRLARDGAIMNQEQRRNLEREIMVMQRDFSRAQEAFSEDLNIRRNELFSTLQRDVRETVAELAREMGYDLVVSDGVVFASERIDITEDVLEKLRSKNESP